MIDDHFKSSIAIGWLAAATVLHARKSFLQEFEVLKFWIKQSKRVVFPWKLFSEIIIIEIRTYFSSECFRFMFKL